MRRRTKKGNEYNCGERVWPYRKSYQGLRDVLEDRLVNRRRSQALKFKLKQKRDRHIYEPETYCDLSEKEKVIYQSLQNMKDKDEWDHKSKEFLRICVGPNASLERMTGLKYLVRSKTIHHPDDSTFTKKVKILNDKGKDKLARIKNRKNRI